MLQINQIGVQLSQDKMEHGNHYALFDHSDYGNVDPGLYGLLLESARQRVYIWDPYCNDEASQYDVFSHINTALDLLVLTNCSSDKDDKMVRALSYIKQNVLSDI